MPREKKLCKSQRLTANDGGGSCDRAPQSCSVLAHTSCICFFWHPMEHSCEYGPTLQHSGDSQLPVDCLLQPRGCVKQTVRRRGSLHYLEEENKLHIHSCSRSEKQPGQTPTKRGYKDRFSPGEACHTWSQWSACCACSTSGRT